MTALLIAFLAGALVTRLWLRYDRDRKRRDVWDRADEWR